MDNVNSKANYPRRVLLCTSGVTPQIVTETLFAMTHGKDSNIHIPTEVHLLTTVEGAERANLHLLTGPRAQFYKLCDEYQLPNIEFSSENIHVIHSSEGKPLSDIRTPDDNQAVADFILHTVKTICSDPRTQLHVSIAGGRKTMGYYLGLALSLFGREQDQLSHVLVDREFESHPDFFFPTIDDHIITNKDGRPLNTKNANVTLASIPFLRLGDDIPRHALVNHSTFNDIINTYHASRLVPALCINFSKRVITAGGFELNLSDRDWITYAWFATRAQLQKPSIPIPSEFEPNVAYAIEYLAIQKRLLGELATGNAERTEEALTKGMEAGFFESRKSYLNTELKKQLGQKLASIYQVASHGPRGRSTFGLSLTSEQITILD